MKTNKDPMLSPVNRMMQVMQVMLVMQVMRRSTVISKSIDALASIVTTGPIR